MNEDALVTISLVLRIAFLASLALLIFALLRYFLQQRTMKKKASPGSVRKRVDSL